MVVMIPAIFLGVHDLPFHHVHDNTKADAGGNSTTATDINVNVELKETTATSCMSKNDGNTKSDKKGLITAIEIESTTEFEQPTSRKIEKFGYKNVLNNFDLTFLVISSSLIISYASLNEIIINLSAADIYKWSLTRLGIVTCICVVLYSSLMLTLGNHVIHRYFKGIYFMSFVMMCICLLAMLLPQVLDIEDMVGQHVQLSAVILINTFTGLSGAVLARRFMFQMVPKTSASFADGVRSFVSRIFGLFALFSGSWAFQGGKSVLPTLGLSMLVMAMICLCRKRFRPSFKTENNF